MDSAWIVMLLFGDSCMYRHFDYDELTPHIIRLYFYSELCPMTNKNNRYWRQPSDLKKYWVVICVHQVWVPRYPSQQKWYTVLVLQWCDSQTLEHRPSEIDRYKSKTGRMIAFKSWRSSNIIDFVGTHQIGSVSINIFLDISRLRSTITTAIMLLLPVVTLLIYHWSRKQKWVCRVIVI